MQEVNHTSRTLMKQRRRRSLCRGEGLVEGAPCEDAKEAEKHRACKLFFEHASRPDSVGESREIFFPYSPLFLDCYFLIATMILQFIPNSESSGYCSSQHGQSYLFYFNKSTAKKS